METRRGYSDREGNATTYFSEMLNVKIRERYLYFLFYIYVVLAELSTAQPELYLCLIRIFVVLGSPYYYSCYFFFFLLFFFPFSWE
jgi:hypothetical protein